MLSFCGTWIRPQNEETSSGNGALLTYNLNTQEELGVEGQSGLHGTLSQNRKKRKLLSKFLPTFKTPLTLYVSTVCWGMVLIKLTSSGTQ